MLLRARIAISLSLAVACTLPGAAAAHGGSHPVGAAVHGDPVVRTTSSRAATRAATVALASPLAADRWCGEPGLGVDGANDIQAVLARPHGTEDRISRYADILQSDASFAAGDVLDASAGTKALRFAAGTSCGPQYLAILSVELPRERAYYADPDVSLSGRLARLRNDLRPLVAYRTQRDYLVYADRMYAGDGSAGAGTVIFDSRPGPENVTNMGGLFAFVFGDGSASFSPSADRAQAALHEITHLLGAVQRDAPHGTEGGHCTQGSDLMCYADAPGVQMTTTCAAAGLKPIDCGGDDYFNPAPPEGSWLATHWNVYDSEFLCDPARCLPADAARQEVLGYTVSSSDKA